MTDLPTGTLTFLFTDVEGSTGMWEHQEVMSENLVVADEILRDAIAWHGASSA